TVLVGLDTADAIGGTGCAAAFAIACALASATAAASEAAPGNCGGISTSLPDARRGSLSLVGSGSARYDLPPWVVMLSEGPFACGTKPYTASSPKVKMASLVGSPPSTRPIQDQLPSACSTWRSYFTLTLLPLGIGKVNSPFTTALRACS